MTSIPVPTTVPRAQFVHHTRLTQPVMRQQAAFSSFTLVYVNRMDQIISTPHPHPVMMQQAALPDSSSTSFVCVCLRPSLSYHTMSYVHEGFACAARPPRSTHGRQHTMGVGRPGIKNIYILSGSTRIHYVRHTSYTTPP